MPTLTDNEMRLECLRLATAKAKSGTDVMPLAEEFYAFASDNPIDELFDRAREHITAQEIGDEAVN